MNEKTAGGIVDFVLVGTLRALVALNRFMLLCLIFPRFTPDPEGFSINTGIVREFKTLMEKFPSDEVLIGFTINAYGVNQYRKVKFLLTFYKPFMSKQKAGEDFKKYC